MGHVIFTHFLDGVIMSAIVELSPSKRLRPPRYFRFSTVAGVYFRGEGATYTEGDATFGCR